MSRNRHLDIALAALLSSGCGSRPSSSPAPDSPPTNNAVSQNVPPEPAAPRHPDPQPTSIPKPTASDPPVRAVVRQLVESDGHGGWRKNEKAATELEKLSPDHVKQVWLLFKDPEAEVRRGAAIYLLPLFDPTSAEQVSAFTQLLDDADRIVRARGIDAVRQFRNKDQLTILPKLIPLLDAQREDRPENRAAVARLCGSLKRDADVAVAALASAARYDPDAKVRASALAAAVAVATTAPVMQALRQGLTDKESAVRLAAASRLRLLGVSATSLAPDLAKALGDSEPDVAENAAEALIAIGTPAVEPLTDQLTAGNATAKRLSLATLATLGPVAKAATAAIEKCRQDADPQVRQLAEAALHRINAR